MWYFGFYVCLVAMYKVLVLNLALVSCYALTDEETALFFNDGCGDGSVSAERVM